MPVDILASGPGTGPGPAMYLGSSMMSFALPYAAFIVTAIALFILFRAKHSGPRLKYSSSALVTSVITREPGPVPVPAPAAASAPAAAGDSSSDERSGGERSGGDAESDESAEGTE
ncbi:MAG: hypothetical protein ACRDN0_13460 [Trebonia sp.]